MKIKLITTTLYILFSNLAFAGGNIDLLEPEIAIAENLEQAISENYFYTGLAYSYMKMNDDTLNTDITGNAISILAGYKFYRYLSLEGRYSTTLGDVNVDNIDKDWDITNLALYLKPQYSLNELTLYGLLGYGHTTLDNGTKHSENAFQWGLGANFSATEDIEVFIDYTRLYDDNGFDSLSTDNDTCFDSVNVGISYNF